MKARNSIRGKAVAAVSGRHSVVLAMDWPGQESEKLLGFAIRRKKIKGKWEWLKTALQFEGKQAPRGSLTESWEAPVQSFMWCDPGLSDDKSSPGLPAGTRFLYEVIPVQGSPESPALIKEDAVSVEISTEPERKPASKSPEAFINRGLSAMQEYERLFGEGHEPDQDPKAQNWLSAGLKDAILSFVGEAVSDQSLLLDVAAYHLDDRDIIKAIGNVGSRARISLDWGPEETEDARGPNGPAWKELETAGVFVHKRRHVSISHNKYMVLSGQDGKPKAVLTGSTNFTTGGVSSQSNQSVIVRNQVLAGAYKDNFEKVLKDDNEALRESNRKGVHGGKSLEAYFSPHSKGNRPGLDRLGEIASNAQSSRLFMTFRMTDKSLIDAILEPSVPSFGVVDRVYKGQDDSGDHLLWKEAHEADPSVVAANFPLSDEPEEGALFRELKREGFEPFIHHKILLFDWDSPDCVVVTGSANYSENSTEHNDENTLIIKGNQGLADEYFAEFCRLYLHWRPRWITERESHNPEHRSHLRGDSGWTRYWAPGGMPASFLNLMPGFGNKDRTAPVRYKGNAGERIKHVFILMLENRSFDQMLGQLPGVDGVSITGHATGDNFVNYPDPQNPSREEACRVTNARFFGIPEGDIPPPHIENGEVSGLYGGPSHSFPAASQQLFNDSRGPGGSGAENTSPPQNSGFVKSYRESLERTYSDWVKADPDYEKPAKLLQDHVEVVMASFSHDQLPVINGLASEFCVCDRWFSEVPGPTEPNRLFIHAATSEGLVHNPWSYPIKSRTIYEDIDKQGIRSWAFYKHDLSDSDNFPALKKHTDRVRDFRRFAEDLKNPENFPEYVFLCPRYMDSSSGFANSQHAPFDVRYGEHWIADVYENIRDSALWENSLLIVTYDEHGGFFDHVFPPDQGVLPPDQFSSPTEYDREHASYMFYDDGQPKKQYQFNFDRLGLRVPTVLISPWIKKGVCESTQLQHTSVIATIRKIWELDPEPLTARESQARTFEHLFEELASPRNDCPAKLRRPPLPERSLREALDQPLSPVQREVFRQVMQLDGHPDTGKEVSLPATQGEASGYIARRRKHHNDHHKQEESQFIVYEDAAGEFRWRLVEGEDGNIIAVSGQGFETVSGAQEEIKIVRNNTSLAKVVVRKKQNGS